MTPERVPLALFGPEASAAVADELRGAGVACGRAWCESSSPAGSCSSRAASASRCSASSPCRASSGPGSRGCRPTTTASSSPGRTRAWRAASGRGRPATASPPRSSSAAWRRTRRAGRPPHRAPRGRGGRARPGRAGPARAAARGPAQPPAATRRGAPGAPLWWPGGKVAGEYLPRWLTEQGITPPPAAAPPEGLTVRRPLRAMSAPRRSTCTSSRASSARRTPAVASLGGRGRPDREADAPRRRSAMLRGMDAAFQGFAPSVFDWFAGLERDNSKAYFTATRERYETEVRGGLEAMLEELGERVRRRGEGVPPAARRAVLPRQVALQDHHLRDPARRAGAGPGSTRSSLREGSTPARATT